MEYYMIHDIHAFLYGDRLAYDLTYHHHEDLPIAALDPHRKIQGSKRLEANASALAPPALDLATKKCGKPWNVAFLEYVRMGTPQKIIQN